MFYIPLPAVRLAQRRLDQSGYEPGPIDGDLGPATERALNRMLSDRARDVEADHRSAIQTGSRKRKLTAWIQLLARDAEIDVGPIDGIWGPQTDYAFDLLEQLEEFGEAADDWRDATEMPNPHGWPSEDESALRSFYGETGDHLTTIELPYPHRLSWDARRTLMDLACHERVANSLERVLERVLDHYGMDRIRELRLDRFGGCFNKRKKRGGSTWSTHAWGIALDYDPEYNKLTWGRDQATFAKPDYAPWWTFWEEEGWISLGRSKNFDWMHVQAARVAS